MFSLRSYTVSGVMTWSAAEHTPNLLFLLMATLEQEAGHLMAMPSLASSWARLEQAGVCFTHLQGVPTSED